MIVMMMVIDDDDDDDDDDYHNSNGQTDHWYDTFFKGLKWRAH